MKDQSRLARRLARFGSSLILVLGLAHASTASAQSPAACAAEWIPTYGGFPLPAYDNGTIIAMAVFDSGHGRELYAGGNFGMSGASDWLARWDGWGWTQIGSGMTGGGVRALAVFDDGSGPALFVGGTFTTVEGIAANHIAKWDGTTWSTLGSGTVGLYVSSLRVFDDGSGPALYVGGAFTSAGGVSTVNLARWNGTAWSAIPTGVNAAITSLCDFDDGSGPALFVGGSFTAAGGQVCNHIAKWNGSSWSALGTGLTGGTGLPQTWVQTITVFDDGNGPALFAGGQFSHAGGNSANHIAKWDGTSWSALGAGTDARIGALAVFNDGSGRALYAGGNFTTAGGLAANAFARWDGSNWTALGSGVGSGTGSVGALVAFDDGHGPQLYLGGHFTFGNSLFASNFARWNASGLTQPDGGIMGYVSCVAMFDDGGGKALFAGGSFSRAGAADVWNIAKWDGSRWSALPNLPLIYDVDCMAVFDDGSGPALYIGGVFSNYGLLRWDGTNWTETGGGLLHWIDSLCVFDDGTGPALYAASSHSSMTGTWLAKLVGSTLVSTLGHPNSPVGALQVFDDGSGPALYAGGEFTAVGALSASHIAKWDGTTWSTLGAGLDGTYPNVSALTVFDDGTGPALYAGGRFATAGGATVNDIARWNGTAWSSLGTGLSPVPGSNVLGLAGFDNGSGARLFVAGNFAGAGGVPTDGLATWDGANWADASSGFSNWTPGAALYFQSATVLDDGTPTGTALFVGGSFAQSPTGDSGLAKFDLPIGCMPLGTPFCSPGSGGVMPCPCGNPPAGARLGCDNSAATGGARLAATGLASLSNDLALLTSSGELPSATSIVLQGTAQIAGGAVFGQGVRCVAGLLKRLYAKTALLGSISVPDASDVSISARSAALGDSIVAGSHRYYGVYYRDPNVLGGCAATSTFNVTQQVDLLWAP